MIMNSKSRGQTDSANWTGYIFFFLCFLPFQHFLSGVIEILPDMMAACEQGQSQHGPGKGRKRNKLILAPKAFFSFWDHSLAKGKHDFECTTAKLHSQEKSKGNKRRDVIPRRCRSPQFCHQVWPDWSRYKQGCLTAAASSELDHWTFYLGKTRDEDNDMLGIVGEWEGTQDCWHRGGGG